MTNLVFVIHLYQHWAVVVGERLDWLIQGHRGGLHPRFRMEERREKEEENRGESGHLLERGREIVMPRDREEIV